MGRRDDEIYLPAPPPAARLARGVRVMGTYSVRWITCDTDGCPEEYEAGVDRWRLSLRAAREEATLRGWSHEGSRDFCDECTFQRINARPCCEDQ